MFYYIYEIKNVLNNKIYIGAHKTSNLDDGYMGSGNIIKKAIEKHGIQNFTKKILEFFKNSQEMYAREKEIVNDEFLLREDVYNLRRGGHGGFDDINKNEELRISKNRLARKATNNTLEKVHGENWRSIIGTRGGKQAQTPSAKEKRKKTRELNGTVSDASFMNTPEILNKKKIKFKEIKHQQGESNNQFGTCWISHKDFGVKKCKKEELDSYIKLGWIRGRNKTGQ